jgi:hypothetical protein
MAWVNLDEEIAEEFALFAGREDEIDDAYERRVRDVTTLRVHARVAEQILELEAVLREEPVLGAEAA